MQWFVEQYQFKTSTHTRLHRLGLKQQAVSRGLSTSDRFTCKELSKYRLKPPKYKVPGTPKKPDKTPRSGQNRFWVIKQWFLGKIRGKNFTTKIFFCYFFTFQVFSGFPAIPASCQNPASSKMANFGQFLATMGETGFFSKKRLKYFFALKSHN